jgi:hypothetical protein
MKDLEDQTASVNEVVRQIYKQITPTFEPGDDGIWSEIHLRKEILCTEEMK